MPLYEYKCTDCGAQFEALVKAGQQLETCGMHCRPSPDVKQYGAGRLERVVSAAFVPGGERSRLGRPDKPDDNSIHRAGLTKYVNEGDGVFKKAAGPGPDTIRRDPKPQ